ncbi:MAG: hypothetical protein DMG06_28755, partial [Acidobacteria bacterium]
LSLNETKPPLKIPSWEGRRRQPSGWVLRFATTHPCTPPVEGNAGGFLVANMALESRRTLPYAPLDRGDFQERDGRQWNYWKTTKTRAGNNSVFLGFSTNVLEFLGR